MLVYSSQGSHSTELLFLKAGKTRGIWEKEITEIFRMPYLKYSLVPTIKIVKFICASYVLWFGGDKSVLFRDHPYIT